MQFTTIIASLMAAVAVSAQATYGNTTTPAVNGTSATNGTASPSGTGVGPSATFDAANAGNRLGSSAAMGLVLVGGIALAL